MLIYGDDGKRKFYFGVVTNGVLVKKVDRAKHYLKIIQGYALQADIFDKHESIIDEIIFEENGQRLRISKEDFLLNRGSWTKGYGRQYTISEKYLQEI